MAYRSSGADNAELVHNLRGAFCWFAGLLVCWFVGWDREEQVVVGSGRTYTDEPRLIHHLCTSFPHQPHSLHDLMHAHTAYGIVESERVFRALLEVDRGDFVPQEVRCRRVLCVCVF
jgi:hypothetical protein